MILRNWASMARMSVLLKMSETSAQCLLTMEESLINLWAVRGLVSEIKNRMTWERDGRTGDEGRIEYSMGSCWVLCYMQM